MKEVFGPLPHPEDLHEQLKNAVLSDVELINLCRYTACLKSKKDFRGIRLMNEIYIKTRAEWRNWLEKNHDKNNGIWLIFYRKESGKPALEYDASVEEALCFGWIDSIIKKLDDERYVRKFTPRKPDSKWSELNKDRVKKLIAQGLMTGPGIALVEEAKKTGLWEKSDRPEISFEMPIELEIALKKNKKAKAFFEQLAPSYRKRFTGWISSAKLQETRDKRVNEAVALLEQGKKLGLK